jgi:Multicopper oxidase
MLIKTLSAINFLSKHQKYFSEHDFHDIPIKFIHRIGELETCNLITGFVAIIEYIKRIYWAFNGTIPGPTLRFTEGEKVSILFINNGTYPHTMHFHGIHDDKNDGVLPVIMSGKSYTYNITAEPA